MIDIQYLISLFEDEVLVRKYLERFHEDMPMILLRMRAACQDQHWNELSILAHSYKCQLQYLNENDTANLAYELEKMCTSKPPNPDEISALITQLGNRLVNTLKEINQIIE